MNISKADKERLKHFFYNMIDRNEALINDGMADENDKKDLEMFERVLAELEKELSKQPEQPKAKKQQLAKLLNHNIQKGIGLLLNCYYDGAITEPKPLSEWIEYVYHEITTNFETLDGVLEMGNKVLRFVGENELKIQIAEQVINNQEVKKYLKKEDACL